MNGQEIIPATKAVINPHPWLSKSRVVEFGDGLTLAQMLDASDIPQEWRSHARIWIGEHEIKREYWHAVRPKRGAEIYLRVMPGRGGGGGKGTLLSILGIVFAIAASIIAPYLGPIIGAALEVGTTIGTAIATAIIGAVGFAIMYAIAPPPKPPELPRFDSGLSQQQYSITGTSNRTNPYGPIPRVFGKRRIYPLVAARPYTEMVANKQYIRLLLCCGWGPLKLSDIRIGETPIANFAGVEIETREGWENDAPITLYTRIIREETMSVLLSAALGWVVRTTRAETSEISFDLTAPQGLIYYTSNGGSGGQNIEVLVQWRKVGDVTWNDAVWLDDEKGLETDGKIIMQDYTSSAVRRGGRFAVPESGTYEIQWKRTTADVDSQGWFDDIYITALRSIKYENPIRKAGFALIALRIKASEQLNGVPDQINCIAESYVPVYDGANWAWQISRNPAWHYTHVLRYRGTDRLLADSRIDLDAMMEWAAANAETAPNAQEPYWQFDGVIEGGSVYNALRAIASHCRAQHIMRDGKYSITRDVAKSTPAAHITPRNSWGFQSERHFIDQPHALKCKFINPEFGYQEDMRIVYADGYNEDNASRFESVDYLACTSPTMVWREGRFQLAQMQLRPEIFKVYQDIEACRVTVGDFVRFAHDVIVVGIASGRITARTLNGSNEVTSFTLDNAVYMENGKSYAMRVRLEDGTSVMVSIVTQAGNDITTVEPVTPIPQAVTGQVGDLYTFGESDTETLPALIRAIAPGPELTAQLSLMDAQAGVWEADRGTIPAYQSFLSSEYQPSYRRPSAPVIDTMVSDETVAYVGSGNVITPRVRIGFTQPSSDVAIARYELQYRLAGGDEWIHTVIAPSDTRTVYAAAVESGLMYDLRLRAVGTNDWGSDWATSLNYLVVGLSTAPPDVEQVRLENHIIRWAYPNQPVDFDGFLVRQSPGTNVSWDNMFAAHSGQLSIAEFDVSAFGTGTRTFYIRAKDRAGNLSVNPGIVVVDLGDMPTSNILLTDDRGLANYPGDIVNGTQVGAELRADDSSDLFLPNATDVFLSDPLALFLPSLFDQMTWETQLDSFGAYMPVDLVLDYVVQGAWNIEYRSSGLGLFLTDPDALFVDGAPDGDLFLGGWDDYLPWPGRVALQNQPYRIRITTASGAERGIVFTAKLLLDVEDVIDRVNDQAIVSGGDRLVLTKTFRAIKNVTLTLQGTGTAVSAKALDKDAALGPLVRCYDKDLVGVAGVVDAYVQGY